MNRGELTGLIKIIRVPEGEAPPQIRRAWVGLTMPCFAILGYSRSARGVLSGEPLEVARNTVAVPQDVALQVMEKYSPTIALWWKQNGFPKEEMNFSFGEDEIEIISGVAMQNIHVWDDQDKHYR